MNSQPPLSIRFLFLFSFVLLLTACTAGNAQFTEQDPAGFFTASGMASFLLSL